MAGMPKATSEKFSDVDDTKYYGSAIYWIRATGVVKGYGDASGNAYAFDPDDNVTREQFAKMIASYVEKIENIPVSDPEGSLAKFPDAYKVLDWASTYLAWAVDNKIIEGGERNSVAYLDP